MPKGKIICGFAGIGKTYVSSKYNRIIDLESSDFKWQYLEFETQNIDKEKRKGIIEKVKNPNWPLNYVNEIITKQKEYDFVLISLDLEVRNLLKEKGYSYIVCFPSKEQKNDFLNRYKKRGNNEKFIENISLNYEKWIDDLMLEENKIILKSGQYLEDVLKEEIIKF